jgi:hypothetical protein
VFKSNMGAKFSLPRGDGKRTAGNISRLRWREAAPIFRERFCPRRAKSATKNEYRQRKQLHFVRKSTEIRFGMSVAFARFMRLFCGALLFCLAAIGEAHAASSSPVNAIPFEYSEGLLWVQVQVPQSVRPLNFLFDTGADVSVINSGTAKALGLKTGNRINVQGVHTTMTGHWPAWLTAKAGNVVLPSEYLALDLSKLARSCRRPLDGLLGADFVRGRVVQIDFASHQIRFPDEVSPTASNTVVPLELAGKSIYVSIGINGRERQRVRLDTGCATALQWVTADTKTFHQSDKPAVGLTKLAIPQAETTVLLGTTHFDRVPTGIHHTAIFPDEAGLLGNGLLSRFKTVTFDTKSARLVLGPI